MIGCVIVINILLLALMYSGIYITYLKLKEELNSRLNSRLEATREKFNSILKE